MDVINTHSANEVNTIEPISNPGGENVDPCEEGTEKCEAESETLKGIIQDATTQQNREMLCRPNIGLSDEKTETPENNVELLDVPNRGGENVEPCEEGTEKCEAVSETLKGIIQDATIRQQNGEMFCRPDIGLSEEKNETSDNNVELSDVGPNCSHIKQIEITNQEVIVKAAEVIPLSALLCSSTSGTFAKNTNDDTKGCLEYNVGTLSKDHLHHVSGSGSSQNQFISNDSTTVKNSTGLNLLTQYNSDSESACDDDDDEKSVNNTIAADVFISMNPKIYREQVEEIESDTDDSILSKDDLSVQCLTGVSDATQKRAANDGLDDKTDTEEEDVDVDECEKVNRKKAKPPRVQGELLLEDLPPIQDLYITVPEEECIVFGKVHSVVEQLVLVNALPSSPLLNLDTVLFLDKGQRVLGEIFDVCGPVSEPLYCIRFNTNDHIKEKNISIGDVVYAAPKTKHTQFVILSSLMKMRGSDASWEHDIEPPPRYLDYSDDEEERQARQRLHKNKRSAQHDIHDNFDSKNSVVSKENTKHNRGSYQHIRCQSRGRPNANHVAAPYGVRNCLPRPPQQSFLPYQSSWHSNYYYPYQYPLLASSQFSTVSPDQAMYPNFYTMQPPLPYATYPLLPPPTPSINHAAPPHYVPNPFSRSATSTNHTSQPNQNDAEQA